MGAASLIAGRAATPVLARGVQGILKGMESDSDYDLATVTERVNRFISAGLHNAGHPKRDPGFHASSMYYLCVKKVIFDVLFPENIPEIPEVETLGPQRIFMVGHAVHEWMQNRWLGPAGIIYGKWECFACDTRTKGFMPKRCPACDAPRRKLFYRERKLRDRSLNLVGSCDGFTKIFKKRAVLEIKTIKPESFRSLKKPLPAHYHQVNVYMHLSKLQHAVVLYINKSTGELKEFLVERDYAIWTDVQNKIGSIRRFIRRMRENGNKYDPDMSRGARGVCFKEDYWLAQKCHQLAPCWKGQPVTPGREYKLPTI